MRHVVLVLMMWRFGISGLPLIITEELSTRLVVAIRRFRPDFIITHDKYDVVNPDHNAVSKAVFAASVQSNSAGVIVEGTAVTKQMGVYGFEPHQTELSHLRLGFLLISPMSLKRNRSNELFQRTAALDRNLPSTGDSQVTTPVGFGNQQYKYADVFQLSFLLFARSDLMDCPVGSIRYTGFAHKIKGENEMKKLFVQA